MYPNFEDKEYVLTNIIGKNFSDPKRGDVVVFQSPTEPDKDFIKRVIGLPGDTIMLKEGDIYINDQKIDQSTFLSTDVKTFSGAFLKEAQPIVIPQDSYVVMGDNRGASSDSREWGFVSRDELIGESLFVYLPLTRMRLIENPFKN
jgi:signal peptidase I